MKNNRVALVTGSSRGIGKAIALALAKENVIVVINFSKSEQEAIDILNKVRKSAPNSIIIKADVSKEEEVKSMVGQIIKRFGRLDYLINNAGITNNALFKDMSLNIWKKVIDVNLTGTFICTKHCFPYIIQSKGRILNIASISGQRGEIGHTNYSASKAGVIGFTKALAKEAIKDGVTVNAISPGLINTKMLNTIPEKVMEKLKSMIPLGRIGEPEDVAELAVFLLLNKGNYITGQVIEISGGLLM